MTKRKIDINPFNAIGSILLLILLVWGLFMTAKLAFKIIAFAAPFLLLATAIIDFSVITDFVKWVFKMLKENPLMGIAAILLTIFGFPVISGFLFGKAMLRRKLRKMKDKYETQTQGEIVDYEEIEVQDVEEQDYQILDLPPRPKPTPVSRKRNNSSNYEQLFDD